MQSGTQVVADNGGSSKAKSQDAASSDTADARLARSLVQLSTELRDLKRVVEASLSSAASPGLGLTIPVVLLCFLISVVIGGLGVVIHLSHQDFGTGLAIVQAGAVAKHDPSAMARRVFLLASGNQIFTFKAAAFAVSALMFFVGAIFVLVKANVPAYTLTTEGSGLKASLSTSSPGLVIITLSVALAVGTLYAKSSLADAPDYDLAKPAAEPAPKATGSASAEATFEENYAKYQRERAASAASSTGTPEKKPQ